jgi:hypothetical protein
MGRGKAKAKTSKIRVIAAERRTKAFSMRKLGASYSEIAAKLGITKQGACKAVRTELANINENLSCDREEVRALELERLDMMLTIAMQHIANGSLDGIARALQIQQRRASYLGLDMPTKVDSKISGDPEGGPIAAFEIKLVGPPKDGQKEGG